MRAERHVPVKEITRWSLRKVDVEEWLVYAVNSYEGAQTVVRIAEDSKAFDVKVGLHWGSVIKELLKSFPRELLCVDDLIGSRD